MRCQSTASARDVLQRRRWASQRWHPYRTALPAVVDRRLKDTLGLGHRLGRFLQQGDQLIAPLASEMVVPAGASLLMLGSQEQRAAFDEAFGRE